MTFETPFLLPYDPQNFRFRKLTEICQRRMNMQSLVRKSDRAYRVVSQFPSVGPTSCSPGLTGRRRRRGFSDRSPAHSLLRYWSQSRSPLLLSVRRDEPWDRLKGCRVADAVIKAHSSLNLSEFVDLPFYQFTRPSVAVSPYSVNLADFFDSCSVRFL